jgi:nucleoside-diphosphate-sugar epimerase
MGRRPVAAEDFMSMHLTTPYQIARCWASLRQLFYHHYELPIVKTRFFNSYGPGEVPAIPECHLALSFGRLLPFTGSGDETRDFTYVMDIVDALLRAGYYERAIGQEMNIASGHEVNILQMAEHINELTGNKAGIVRVERRTWDTKKRLLACIDRAKDVLGYEPQMDFEVGLRQTIQWFRDHWQDVRRDAEFPPGTSAAARGVVVRPSH